MELLLIRHGETPGNAARRYVGVLDQPLSDAGRIQARNAGVHEDQELVYTSTMRRAHETAAIMFPQARQVEIPGIHEMDFGAFAGHNADEMLDDVDYRRWIAGNCEGRCPGGESRAEFIARTCAAMESFLFSAWERGEKRVIVVAHGGTMMAILSRYADEPRDYYDWLVGNCCGYRIDVRFPMQAADSMKLHPKAYWGSATVTGRANAPFPPKAPGQ